MGADARWVCHTCKTICYADGSRDLWGGKKAPIPEELKSALGAAKKVAKYISDSYYDTETPIKFLEMLSSWLGRHQNHEMWVTSDYGIDMGDWEEYRTETVEGKVNELTKEEEMREACRKAREANIIKIQGIIGRHKIPEEAAPEIADLFIYPYGY